MVHANEPAIGRNARLLLPIAGMIALRLASAPTANASYLALAFYALFGRAHAIRALLLSWLFTMVSPAIAPLASADTVGRYAVLVGAAASVFMRSGFLSAQPRLRSFTTFTLLLGLFIIGHSLLLSPVPAVSILKAVSWTVATTTSLSAWRGLEPADRDVVARQVFWGLVALLLVSLPLVVSSLGYVRNAQGFQGVLNHPQAFGLTTALLGAWAASSLFAVRQPPWWLVGLTVACLAAVLLSQARTAAVALVSGVGLSLVVARALSARFTAQVATGLQSARVWAAVGVALFCGIATAPIVQSEFASFVAKSDRAEVGGLVDAYRASRGDKIDEMLANIESHPVVGIGFGIASDAYAMAVQYDSVLGLPIGAAIEKGVAPLAVMEELGIGGALLTALWVFQILRRSARGGLTSFAVCLTALFLNMGESTLFSPGGFGLLPLVLFGWTCSGRGRQGSVDV